jgi:hypothetical protein
MDTNTINTDTLIDPNTPPDTDTVQAEAGTVGSGWLVRALADLPPAAMLDEVALAGLLGCHRCSIRRGVERGELPAPARLLGKPAWTAGRIIDHFTARLEAAEAAAERERARIARLGA